MHVLGNWNVVSKRSGADETANVNVFALGLRYMF